MGAPKSALLTTEQLLEVDIWTIPYALLRTSLRQPPAPKQHHGRSIRHDSIRMALYWSSWLGHGLMTVMYHVHVLSMLDGWRRNMLVHRTRFANRRFERLCSRMGKYYSCGDMSIKRVGGKGWRCRRRWKYHPSCLTLLSDRRARDNLRTRYSAGWEHATEANEVGWSPWPCRRREVEIWGREAVLRAAIGRSPRRSSGLADALAR